MKQAIKKFAVFFLCFWLVSCATVDPAYYTNPNSPGYTQQVLGGICEKCNRVFMFSGQQYDNIENVQCCYCGHIQNLKMAYNRYIYLQQQQEQEKQRQQALANQIAVNNFSQSYQRNLEQSTQRQQQIYENMGNAFLNWGGLKGSTNYQYIPAPPSSDSYQSQGVIWRQGADFESWHSSDGKTCSYLSDGSWYCR